MSDVFLRQREAWAFVQAITDPTERLLTEVALAHAMSSLVTNPDYQGECAAAPFDLLNFVRGTSAFFRNKQVLSDILSGKIKTMDDLDPFS